MVSFLGAAGLCFFLLLVSASRWVRWILSRVSPLLCSCYCPVRAMVRPLVVEVEDPRHVSYLCFCSVVWGRLDQRNSHWETNPWVFLLWDCTPVSVLCCIPFCPLYRLTNYTSAGTTFDPTLTVGIQANRPYSFSGVLFTRSLTQTHLGQVPGLQYCAPGPTVGAVETTQILAWPSPYVNVPTNPNLLQPDPSQLKEHLFSVEMLCSTEFRKLSGEV